ncbi:MAG: hypothetical protein R2690_03800 [Acidimicrobiales bacterium]
MCFHAEPKLRTVIWDFAYEPIPAPIVDGLCRLGDGDLPAELRTLLSVDEVDQLELRARGLVRHGVFPHDPTGRRVPWPLV